MPHPKCKKAKSLTVYKQYTSSDLLAALEEVKKGKSALQVSKHFNIPSRTLYDKARKMGITNQRHLASKSLKRNSEVAYGYAILEEPCNETYYDLNTA